MRKIGLILMAFALIGLFSCGDKKKSQTKPPVEIVPLDSIPGIFEAHGTIGDGSSMNVIEFINDNGDTLYITKNSQTVMGGVVAGNELEIIYNVADKEIFASVAVNLTSLQHTWTQRGKDGQEQSLELDATPPAITIRFCPYLSAAITALSAITSTTASWKLAATSFTSISRPACRS